MKTLYLMRHAKTEQADWGMKDFTRNLTNRGLRDAEEMGNRLLAKENLPEVIASSTAYRAIATAKIVARVLKFSDKQLVEVPKIYEASVESIMETIREIPETISAAILVGHNPTFTHMCGQLTPTLLEALPTAGILCLKLNIHSWKDCHEQCGEFLWIDRPKNLEV